MVYVSIYFYHITEHKRNEVHPKEDEGKRRPYRASGNGTEKGSGLFSIL